MGWVSRVFVFALVVFSVYAQKNDVMWLYKNASLGCVGNPDGIFHADTSICDAGCVALAQVLPGDQNNDACQDGTRCINSDSSEPLGTAPGYARIDCDASTPADLNGVKFEFYENGCCEATPKATFSFRDNLFPFPLPDLPAVNITARDICVPQAPIPGRFIPNRAKRSDCGSLKIVWNPALGVVEVYQYGSGCTSLDLNLDCSGPHVANATYGMGGNCIGFKNDEGELYSVYISYPGLTKSTGTTFCAFSDPCFHSDTRITYGESDYSMEEIRAHPECTIPHVVSDRGVLVEASCSGDDDLKTLRLTDGHLVYTARGLQRAADLQADSDVVFADIAQTRKCKVVRVEKETSPQHYFGLNCLNSQVLASGIKTSTFERFHALPSWWMYIVGNVVGVERASQIGDFIVQRIARLLMN